LRNLLAGILLAMLLVLPVSLAAQTTADPRLQGALDLAVQEDWQAARNLALVALAAATAPLERWQANQVLAAIAHWQGDDSAAIALLEPLIATGAALFGEQSPQLIAGLRMLAISQGGLGDEPAMVRTQIKALRIARTAPQDVETQLATMADLSRSFIDLGLNPAAALLSAGAQIVAAGDSDRGEIDAQEAHLLRALAHLRMGHPVEAIVHALPIYRLAPQDLWDEAAELIEGFDAELLEAAEALGDQAVVIPAWLASAEQRLSARQAEEMLVYEALQPMMLALEAGDILAADRVARAALQTVLADDPLVVNTYFALMTGALAKDHFELALTWADRLAAIAPGYLASLDIDPNPGLRKMADWLIDHDRAAAAIPLARAISEIARLRDGAAAFWLQKGLLLQGQAARRALRWSDAETHLTAALAVADLVPVLAGDRAKIKVQTLVELAVLAENQGRIAEAEQAYTGAIAVLQNTDAGVQSDGWVFVLGELGALLTTAGRLDEAEALLLQSLALAAKDGAEPGRNDAQTYYELARLQLYAGKFAAAQSTADRALEIAHGALSPDDPQLRQVYLLQASLLGLTGQPDAAFGMMTKALAGTGGDTATRRAAMLMQQAVLATNSGAPSEGRRLMDQALATALADDPIYGHLLAAAGAIALADGDAPTALGFFRRATLDLTRPQRRAEQGAGDHLPLHADTARRLSDAENGIAATNLMAEAFVVAQRVNDISAGLALSKASARLQGGSAELADLARDLETADQAIEVARETLLARLAAGENAVADRRALEAFEADHGALRVKMATAFPRYAAYADPKPYDLAATMLLLKDDEVLVLFASSGMTGFNAVDSGTVIALSSTDYVAAGLPPRTEVEALTRGLRCSAALTDRACNVARAGTRGAFSLAAVQKEPAKDTFDLALAHQAYVALLGPVAAAFDGKKTLIVVPDKTLAAMPFHLMLTTAPDDATGMRNAPWLLRKMAVMIVPTVASLASLRSADAKPSAASKPFLGIGDPLIGVSRNGAVPYDCEAPPEVGLFAQTLLPANAPILRGGGSLADVATLVALTALPETRCELQATARLLGTPDATILQGDATESRVKQLSEQGGLLDYRVVSFATHGLIAGELGDHIAGLVLTPPERADAADDGLLTTAEIANLRLDADFVLLSACNTAAGATQRDEGLSGLASAFFLAGARSLLVSHWPVYSAAASQLTTSLFDRLARDPAIGRAEALRQVMLGVLDDPASTDFQLHPAWWGAFMIAGEAGAGR